jgi:hypothetical protein
MKFAVRLKQNVVEDIYDFSRIFLLSLQSFLSSPLTAFACFADPDDWVLISQTIFQVVIATAWSMFFIMIGLVGYYPFKRRSLEAQQKPRMWVHFWDRMRTVASHFPSHNRAWPVACVFAPHITSIIFFVLPGPWTFWILCVILPTGGTLAWLLFLCLFECTRKE